jgi:NADP-dependent aldehyde dehydrogenase
MTVTSFDPRTGRVVGAAEETVAVASVVAAATRAATVLAGTAPGERRGWLEALADAVEEHADELAALADTETALGRARLDAEVAGLAVQLRFYGEVAAEGSYLGATVDSATATAPRLVRVKRPVGAVAVFGAGNFPFRYGLLGHDTGSALAAGCAVVAKAHPAHQLTCGRLAEIATEALAAAGAPAGVFGVVTGLRAGTDLVRSPGIAAVGFTGSQAGGTALWRIANEREQVIPVYAEMGTVNPVVLTPAAAASRLAEVAAGFVGSFTLGSGQFCTKPGLLFAPAGSAAAQAVSAALREAGPSPVMLTEAIAANVRRGLESFVDAGAEVVGHVPGPGGGWSADAAVLAAPIGALKRGSRLLEECFGPVALVVEYADAAELTAGLGELQGSLAGSVFTAGDDDPGAPAVVATLAGQVGRVTVNDWPTGATWTWAQHHGGPWPATSNPAHSSVGAAALDRWVRPVAFQSTPAAALPPGVREAVDPADPWDIPQRIDGVLTRP